MRQRHITLVTDSGEHDELVGYAISPLRAFRGVLVCVLEGSPDESLLHLAAHMTLAEIERLDSTIDDSRSTAGMRTYLYVNASRQRGLLALAFSSFYHLLADLDTAASQ